jgi:hypothetical protein
MNWKALTGCLAIPLVVGSCGTMQTVKNSTAAMVAKMPSLPKLPSFPKPGTFGDHPKVVEVREKDLKKLPLGHERAMAFQNSGGIGWWPMGDVNFEPAALPEPGSDIDPSLLPPP